MDTLLVEQLEVDERLKALASIYQLTDFIIAGERLTVTVGQYNNTKVPAWTTGTEIVLNAAQFDSHDFDDLVRFHGLNFHELAHVMFSPRAGTSLVQWAMEHFYAQAFNILEDQRIESLMTTKYPSTAPWLSASVLRWVLNDPNAVDLGYMFVRGRRYLPGELRGLLRSRFVRPEFISDINRIIDAYRRLVFPSDYTAARALIQEFDTILRQLYVDHGSVPDPNGHSEHPHHQPDTGRPVPVKDQRNLRDKMTEPKQDEGKPSPSEASDEDKEEGESEDAAGSGESESEESNENADEQSNRPNGSGRGDSSDDNDPDSKDNDDEEQRPGTGVGGQSGDLREVRDAVEDMLSDLLSSDEVRKDIRQVQRQIRIATGADVLPMTHYFEQEPLPEYSMMSHQLIQTLGRLREAGDPGWHREEDYGRINVIRWAIDRDPHTAFDRWDEGVNDICDIEAVIMLDSSGSMGCVAEQAFNAMWVLKRSFDAVEVSSTVIVFDHESNVLYKNGEQASPLVRTSFRGGGTDPVDGLNQAARIFASSNKTHKLLVAITDGQWGWHTDDYGLRSEDYIDRMNDAGVITALAFIPGLDPEHVTNEYLIELARENSHHAKIAAAAYGDNLVPFVANIVTDLMRSRLLAHR